MKLLLFLMIVWLSVLTVALCDRPNNSEMDLAWHQIGINAEQAERARLLAVQAINRCEQTRLRKRDSLPKGDDEYPWLEKYFRKKAGLPTVEDGRDPFRRMP